MKEGVFVDILEGTIRNELIKFSEDTSRQTNQGVTDADRAIATVMDKVNKSDKLLGDELENANDLIMLAYSDMYFREGFMTALKLINGINKVS